MTFIETLMGLASVFLAGLSVLVAISAIVGFAYIKSTAASIAQEEAKRVAEEIAEKIVCNYLQAEGPSLVREHLETFTNGYTLSPDMGNEIAEASI